MLRENVNYFTRSHQLLQRTSYCFRVQLHVTKSLSAMGTWFDEALCSPRQDTITSEHSILLPTLPDLFIMVVNDEERVEHTGLVQPYPKLRLAAYIGEICCELRLPV
jgi:hypothetical protein